MLGAIWMRKEDRFMEMPHEVTLTWQKQYRIVPTVFPPQNFFADIVRDEQLEALWFLEGLTNDRLREERGETHLIANQDYIAGPGASTLLAPFTHIGYPSRFSRGEYGVYYAAKSIQTAIKETVYHKELFLHATKEPAMELAMRVFVGEICKPLHDLRHDKFAPLHQADDYTLSQQMGATLRQQGAWGVVYNSVRDEGGECIGAFRPPCLSIPKQGMQLAYVWDGSHIKTVFEKRDLALVAT